MSVLLVLLENGVVEMVRGQFRGKPKVGKSTRQRGGRLVESNLDWSFPLPRRRFFQESWEQVTVRDEEMWDYYRKANANNR